MSVCTIKLAVYDNALKRQGALYELRYSWVHMAMRPTISMYEESSLSSHPAIHRSENLKTRVYFSLRYRRYYEHIDTRLRKNGPTAMSKHDIQPVAPEWPDNTHLAVKAANDKRCCSDKIMNLYIVECLDY